MEDHRSREALGCAFAVILGLIACGICLVTKSPLCDPLLSALVIGFIARAFLQFRTERFFSTKQVPNFLIPIGVLLYGGINLDFSYSAIVKLDFVFLTLFVFMFFVLVSLSLCLFARIKEKVAYLLTVGSTICGASAITVTSQAIDADTEDVSVSIVAVFLAGVVGLFVVLPFIHHVLRLSDDQYAVFSGAIFQFTGFVKVAVRQMSDETQSLAMSVKALRYLGLLFLVPFFASLIKGKIHIPWFLWGFLASGVIFSMSKELAIVLRPALRPVLDILWTSAMAAIGFNTNLKTIFSLQGLKAFAISLLAFVASSCILILGFSLGVGL